MSRKRPRGPWGDRARLKTVRRTGKLPGPPPVCSSCGKMLDMWTAIEPGQRPQVKPGETSISICWYCGTLHEFVGPPEQLRLLTGEELILAMADPTVRKARATVILARAMRERGITPDGIVAAGQIGAGADSAFIAIVRKAR